MNRQIHFIFSLLLSLGIFGSAYADDTEIYRAEASDSAGTSRPKVLIVFDNSGSMVSGTVTTKVDYDPNTTYDTYGNIRSDRIYWSTDGEPPSHNTSRYFTASANRCASSETALDEAGTYADRMLASDTRTTHECTQSHEVCVGWEPFQFCWDVCDEWEETTETEWRNLSTNEHNPDHVECQTDVADENADNLTYSTDGFPSSTEDPYGCSTAACSVSEVSFDRAYTLYSANYMNYYYGTSEIVETRLEVAKKAINNIITANPGVDFGLMIFNYNEGDNSDDHNGGRVIKKIIEDMTAAQRETLKTTVTGIQQSKYTPLCETSYEAFRYLTTDGVLYGNDKRYSDTPDRDTTAESDGYYVSPGADICKKVYIILMTDGAPTYDEDANIRIKDKIGKTGDCGYYPSGLSHTGDRENCLPELAEYMNTHDLDGDEENGTQIARFYTIGFASSQKLLEDTAKKGDGQYYEAQDGATLTSRFQSAIMDIMQGSSTFTSPTISVDTFNRTQSRNEIFLATFEPKEGERWPGNLKKLKVGTDASGELIWMDKNGDNAIDTTTSEIKDTATTYWSTSADGSSVEKGGVGQLLVERTAARNIYINTGDSGALEAFISDNIDYQAYGLASAADLFELIGVADQDELTSLINWGRGIDVLDEDEDGNATENRSWILGDSLHSTPLAINYGCEGTDCEPDIRVVLGTNEGFLHMFKNSDGSESWAFFPAELAPLLKLRMDNDNTDTHSYGVDGSAVSYILDNDHDGYIESDDGDKVYIFFGLRRGGRSLYALDVTDPDDPKFKWSINYAKTGFGKLGQTWSTPQVAKVPGETNPSLIFGGGYDTNKDGTGIVNDDDTMGNAIFIVDIEDGSLVKTITHDNLDNGIAAPVNVLDSDGDGISDRIYAADTGGNVWRADMPGTDTDGWVLRHLADFNGGNAATDRRFFNQPDVVFSYGYYAVMIGSGDRTNPLATDVTNRLYAIWDKRIYPYYDSDPTNCDGSSDFRCKMPLHDTAADMDLYDATDNDIQQGTDEEKATAATDLYSSNGWFINLEDSGEKALAASTTTGFKTGFTTYAPNAANEDLCAPAIGTSYFYALSMFDGRAVFDLDGSGGDLDKDDRRIELGGMILDTPSIHVDEDGNVRLFFPAGGTGSADNDNVNDNKFDLEEKAGHPIGTFWYMKE